MGTVLGTVQKYKKQLKGIKKLKSLYLKGLFYSIYYIFTIFN